MASQSARQFLALRVRNDALNLDYLKSNKLDSSLLEAIITDTELHYARPLDAYGADDELTRRALDHLREATGWCSL